MIVMIDNYDSFTYNLVQYMEELGGVVRVFRNDKVTVAEVENLFQIIFKITISIATDNDQISLAGEYGKAIFKWTISVPCQKRDFARISNKDKWRISYSRTGEWLKIR